jgi:hypothetical protein
MQTRHVRSLSLPLRFLLAGAVCGGLFAAATAAQPPPEGPARAADKAEKHVFTLRHVRATEAARVLREMYRESADLALGVDERTNSLVLSAKAEVLADIAKLLQQLDKEAPDREPAKPEFQVIALRFLAPDQSTEDALRLVLDGRRGRFSLDRERKLVVLYADRETLQGAAALLQQLDQMARDVAGPAPVELTVRLVCLVNGPADEKATAVPEDLKEVAETLRKLGIDRPSLAAQSLIRTQFNARFEQSGQARLGEATGLLTATGQVSSAAGAPRLDITVRATQTGRDSGPLLSLQTQVTVQPGQPVVLGVTPLREQTAAFVVQLLPPLPVPKPAEKPAKPAPSPKETEKANSFEFRQRPWNQVFEWLSDQTGLPVTPVEARLTGAFTFIPPRGKQYTLPEIIDILNESLMQQRHILIRRERQFTILPADQIDPLLVPRVRIEDLEQRGNTELVSVVVPLKALTAGEIAPEIKKMLGPFGEVIVISQGNRLLLRDMAVNLRRIHQLIHELESRQDR